VQEYVVDASGDLRHYGRQAIRVGLEHPILADRVIGAMELRNEALCASAVTRRAWRGLHHLVDPRTGSPTRDIIATWVVAHTAALADGLANALFFSDPRILAQTFDFAFVRMRRDHHVEASAHFDGELFVPSASLHHIDHEKVTS